MNLDEQFAVFAQTNENDSRRFLLFICGIASFNLIKYLFTNQRRRRLLCDARTNATILTTFELLLHLLNFVVAGPTEETRGKYDKCIDLGVQLVVAVVCNGIPYRTLFVKGDTQSHDDDFEYLLILDVSMSSIGYLRPLRLRKKRRPDFTELRADEPQVLKVYIWIKFAIGIVINYVTMPIIIFVISLVELARDPSTLDSYDRNAYIVLIVFMGVYFLLTPLFTGIFTSIVERRNKNGISRLER